MNQPPDARVLVISFELVNPAFNGQALVARLKELGDWARLTGTSYLSYTVYDPKSVRDWLGNVLQENDKVYISLAGPVAAWRGFPEVISDWIRVRQG